MPQTVQVLVQTFYTGKTHAIRVDVDDTVVDLKKKIAAKENGLHWHKLSSQQYVRLLQANTELNDTDIIGEVGLKQDTMLKLLPRIKGRAADIQKIGRANSCA